MIEKYRAKLPKNRFVGIALMLLGGSVLFMPILVGEWVIALLGTVLIGAGIFQLVGVVRSTDEAASYFDYLPGILSILFGLILFISPRAVLSGLLVAVVFFFLIEGGIKLIRGLKEQGADRWWSIFNGVFTLALAVIVLYLLYLGVGMIAIVIVLGLRLLAEGWTIFLHRESAVPISAPDFDTSIHPDSRLGLAPSEAVRKMQEAILQNNVIENKANVLTCLRFLGLFFVIHLLRTEAKWSFIGFISPGTATIGDAVMSLIIAVALLLPLRLLLRKLSRPIERTAWKRFERLDADTAEPTIVERALGVWLEERMKLAMDMREVRYSLHFAFWRLLRIGMPMTALFIAVNSIWGFSWYFNSENWASGVWQEITKVRVDSWRKKGAETVERDAVAKGIAAEKVFTIEPEGVADTGDFSFIVIGDTGEGDPSQMVLRDQLIAAGHRENVKFLVLSSDVIYPDGKMKDYETNFYMAFKGFEKPIYAIPGNHDWFDANEGFNANFLERNAAVATLRSRLLEDVKSELITTNDRFDEITAEAARLREYYRVRNGLQRGPFFEMHTAGFSLISVDTGILRQVDEKEKAWLESALQKAGSNFKLVILGHPFYVAGKDTAEGDVAFNELRETLRRYGADVVMAGDTHDFEFYKEKYSMGAEQREMLHFVNGGGGAYLSIGTAASFPADPFTPDYAFYPRTDELKTKIYKETPNWKLPFWWWMEHLGGYPFDSEMVSGAFDFNRAPFFQSFLEVSVERSQNRIRFLLYGVNGPLRWRDIQVGGAVKPPEKTEDDLVEFVVPMLRLNK